MAGKYERLRPFVAIRERCRECSETLRDIERCTIAKCELYPFRMGRLSGRAITKRRNAIRKYCLSCCGDSESETRLCHIEDCPLWPYRHGGHRIESREGEEIGRICGRKEKIGCIFA